MVHRNTDTPRDLLSRTKDNAQRLDDLARATGRGSTAMRDSAGNALVMNGEAPYPLLTPVGTDAAIAFTPEGVIKITDETTTKDRDMTVRDIRSSGNVQANNLTTSGNVTSSGNFVANGGARFNGTMTAGAVTTGDATLQNVYANGTLNSTGFTYVGGGLKVGAAYDTVGGRITSRELTTVGNMACDGNFYLKGSTIPNSDARLKHRFAVLESSPLRAFTEVEWPSWEWKPDPSTDAAATAAVDGVTATRHVMATAQDMLAHPLLRTVVRSARGPGAEDSDVLGFDTSSLLGLACAALHEAGQELSELRDARAAQDQQIDALRSEVAAMRRRVDEHTAA